MTKSQAVAAMAQAIDMLKREGQKEALADPSVLYGYEERLKRLIKIRNSIAAMTDENFHKWQVRDDPTGKNQQLLF